MTHLVDDVLTLTTVDPTVDPRWAELIENHESDVFQSPDWIRVVAETYGFEPRARILARDSVPVAGLAYCRVEGLAGERVVSFPFSDYCDPIVASLDQWRQLTAGLGEGRVPVTVRTLHNPVPGRDDGFSERRLAHWHAVDLGGEDPWGELASSARRAIRKSRSAGVEVREAGDRQGLRAFYELHLRTRKAKYRLLAQPFAFFENIWREFVETGRGRLLLAHVAGHVAAGVLVLEWNERLYYKFNASDPAQAEARPNDAVMWAGIEYGRERGHQLIDLGLSDWGQEGLVRYKQKYANRAGTISFLAAEPPGWELPVSPLAAAMPEITRLLTEERVPDQTTEAAGEVLYRFFA